MANNWFEERKDMFIRDMVDAYLKARVFFEQLYQRYKKDKVVEFKQMDYWVGTEVKKGPLWNLKEQCHALFRNPSSSSNLFAYLFDWTVGSIFHECMKLKENVYQLESYQPEYEKIKQNQSPAPLDEILKEMHLIISRAGEDLEEGMEKVRYLFNGADFRLKKILSEYPENDLLVRFLIENESLVEEVYGKNSLKEIFESMYNQRGGMAYFIAGKSYSKGGWYKESLPFFKKALEIDLHNPEFKEELEKARKNWLKIEELEEKK